MPSPVALKSDLYSVVPVMASCYPVCCSLSVQRNDALGFHFFFPDRYIGCYEDDYSSPAPIPGVYDELRILETYIYREFFNINSNGRCIKECAIHGSTYAGTEVGLSVA